MLFNQIKGHKEEISLLRTMVDTDKLPHAIMLAGPAGIGKMQIARSLAQYVHCEQRKDGNACGECPSCLRHQSFNSPDLYFVYPVVKKGNAKTAVSQDFIEQWRNFISSTPYPTREKWNEAISAGNSQPSIMVEESREMLRIASLSPFIEDKKIFIVWLPERMNVETANKLLKVIEEPYEDTFFIFVSDNPENLLPTISSRLSKVNLHYLPDQAIYEILTEQGASEEEASEITRIAEGRAANALQMLDNSGEEKEFDDLFVNVMRLAYSRDFVKLKSISEKIAEFGREKICRFLKFCQHLLRENYIYNFGINQINRQSAKQEEFSKKFSPFVNSANIERLTSQTNKAALDIMRNANLRIVLFHLMIEYAIEIRKK